MDIGIKGVHCALRTKDIINSVFVTEDNVLFVIDIHVDQKIIADEGNNNDSNCL